MTRLVAAGRRLDAAFDVNDLVSADSFQFIRGGVGLVGQGVAAKTSTRVKERLSSIEVLDDVAHPVAFGSIPFRRDGSSTFVIPAVTFHRTTDDDLRVTAVASDVQAAHDLLDSAVNLPRSPQPTPVTAATFSVRPLTPVDTYMRAVTAARDAVRDGSITKAVIARDILVSSDRPIDVLSVLRRLRAAFGSSYRYSFDGFIGASPELLVSVFDRVLRSHPLAGTTTRTGDPDTDARLASELLASDKNQIEHRVVVDMVHDTLLPYCSYLDWEAEPSVVPVANVQHLGTRVEGRLNTDVHAVDLAQLLSPTPALGGHPRDAAVRLIDAVEGMDRGRYGGAIGWCDAAGNGTFAVAIRCAEFSDDRTSARLFAGGGIVADSVPEAELAETQGKFQAMLSAIVRP